MLQIHSFIVIFLNSSSKNVTVKLTNIKMIVTNQDLKSKGKGICQLFVCKPIDINSLTCHKLPFSYRMLCRPVKTDNILLSSVLC